MKKHSIIHSFYHSIIICFLNLKQYFATCSRVVRLLSVFDKLISEMFGGEYCGTE